MANGLWAVHPEVVLFDHAERLVHDRFDAVVFGPGLGMDGRIWSAWNRLQAFEGLLVLDADGLNALAADQQGWRWLLNCWPDVDPASGRIPRLFPELTNDSSLDGANKAALMTGTVVLYKVRIL